MSDSELTEAQQQFAEEQRQRGEDLEAEHRRNHPERYRADGLPQWKYREHRRK